jgi:hypothetical protein
MTDAAAGSAFMGAREIVVRMGLSRQRVQQIAERADFPPRGVAAWGFCFPEIENP